MLLPQFRDKGIRVQKNWPPIVISQLTESHGKIQGLQRLECIDHPNRTLKTWMEPIALPGQLLTFRGEGLLLLLLSLCFFFPTDLPCTKACPSKIISDSHTCRIIIIFFTIIKHVSTENFSPWSLGEPTQCWSSHRSFLTHSSSSVFPPNPHYLHVHPPGSCAFIN